MTEAQNTHSWITAENKSYQPSRGQPFPRIYEPAPPIENDSNAQADDSSLGDPQTGPVVNLPYVHHHIPQSGPKTHFLTLQAWEGVVTAVEADSFTVKLVDLMSDMPDEEADIDFEDVSKDERALVTIGAIFLLYVGYATSEGGQRSRTTILRFRRLPVWTETELASAKKAAREKADQIRWK